MSIFPTVELAGPFISVLAKAPDATGGFFRLCARIGAAPGTDARKPNMA